MTDAGSSAADLLIGESSVSRSMLILSPSSVRAGRRRRRPCRSGWVTDSAMPSWLEHRVDASRWGWRAAGLAGAGDPVGVDRHLLAGDVHVLHLVDPVTLPVAPSEVAVAVDVTLPMVMKPPRMEMPRVRGAGLGVADVPGAATTTWPTWCRCR